MKPATLLVPTLLLASCASLGFLSDEDRQKANSHWENADTYFRRKDYARSEDQIQRGLKLDADHYKLNLLMGSLLLQKARANPELFRDALEQFEKVRGLRSADVHVYTVWVGLGMANQGLYNLHRKKAVELRREAAGRGLEKTRQDELLAQAAENLRLFETHLREAERNYRKVAHTREQGSYLANERLFMVEIDKAWGLEGAERHKQFEVAARQAEEYLRENVYRQRHYKVMLEKTGHLPQEELARRTLRYYRDRERDFRSDFAELLYELGEHEKAKVQLDKVLEIDPLRASDYYNRALCNLKLTAPHEARVDFEHFLRLTKQSFDAPQVKEATRMLDQLARK